MRKDFLTRKNNAQVTLEYVVLISIVAGVIVVMTVFLKRGIQAVVKVTADQIGLQNEAEQKKEETKGYLVNSYTAMRQHQEKEVVEYPGSSATVLEYRYNDRTATRTTTFTNLGVRNKVQ